MFEVYQDKIKRLINDLYEPGSPGMTNHDIKMTTHQIKSNLEIVIPANYIDEPTVFECLEELGFFPKYEQKQEIVKREIEGKNDAEGNQLYETDIVDYDDLVYYWYLKKRDND